MTTGDSTNSETEEQNEEQNQNTSTEQDSTETATARETQEKPNNVAAMEAALRKANREAESARKKLKEIEDAGKSETDKLRDEKTTAERERDEARKQALRLEVAIAKKLPMSLASRLQGDTKEEMEADATSLLSELKPGSPTGDADQGKRGPSSDSKKDMNSLLRAAVRGGS